MNTVSIKISFLKVFLGSLLIALIVSIMILACVPPVSRDALTHHLAIPKLYLKHGGIYEIPSLIFSYYPMNLDLLYIVPLYFGYDIIPKFIHFAFALFTAWLIFSYVKKKFDMYYALVGVLLFLSLPLIIKLSISVYVDLGLVFFSTASLIYFLKWIENSFKWKYLVIAAIWCGLALGTKYNGLILFVLLTLFVPFMYSRKSMSIVNDRPVDRHKSITNPTFSAIGYTTIFLLISLVIFSPWIIQNYLWTKNPVYPLFHQWFQTADTETNSDLKTYSRNSNGDGNQISSGAFTPFMTRKIIYKEPWWQTATIPVRIFFQGQDDNPKYFDGRLNPYLLILPILSFFPCRREDSRINTDKNILMAFAILFLLFAFFQTDMRVRYIAPIIPPLVILSVFGLRNLNGVFKNIPSEYLENIGKGFIILSVSLLLSLNAGYVWGLYQRIDPMSYISGKLSRDEYIERYRPEYAAIKYANTNLPEDAKIFCLFIGNRSYYSDREMFFGDNLFGEIVKRANSTEKMVIDLKKNNITHILIYYHVFNQWSSQHFENEERRMLLDFFEKHAKLVFAKGGYGLYQL